LERISKGPVICSESESSTYQ